MFINNPFADIATAISPTLMKSYVILMVLLVIAGTLLDLRHKQSAKYFFENSKKAQGNARRKVGGAKKAGLAVKTVAPVLWPLLWHLGALSLCVGGYWFWFAIRVDVAAEGVKWHQFNGRGDLFILGLLFTATFGLLWSFFSAVGAGAFAWLLFALFILSATVLFGSVYWSKFAHMFFKPAAAFQKKVAQADGSNENLPDDYDLSDPEVQAKFPDIPEYMGANPPNMGLGIKREPPCHY